MAARRGDTLLFPTPPVVAAHAAIGGKKEGEGPLAACFDELSADNFFGQSNWEAAEKEMALRAARLCLKKAETTPDKVSLALAGDLQAQCTASSYALRELGIPFVGLFGACSTMAEALGLGAALCSAGMADGLLAMTSSHFCAAERQFRTPLSYGAVRTPTAQWTATAAGACLLRPAGEGVQLCAATFGRVQDYKIKDINNMGAAMAPAAAATLLHYLKDTGSAPADWAASMINGTRHFRHISASCLTGRIYPNTLETWFRMNSSVPSPIALLTSFTMRSGCQSGVCSTAGSMPCSASGRMTALCSKPLTAAFIPGLASAWMAILSACVAFCVNTTRDGSYRPNSAAACSRQSYTRSPARCAAA